MGTTGPVKNVKSKKPNKSPKKECSVTIKKGSKEEIGDKKKSAKVTRKKEDGKEDKNKDGTHNNDLEIDEDSEEKVKPKWIFPPKKVASSSTKKKKVEYTNFSVVKMGCNKCTEVFYSEGGYNDHLYRKHKIKNVSKYLQTILNTIWQWLPPLPKPVENDDMRFLCPQCGTKFFKKGDFETHEYFCYKLSSKDKEARAKNLYERVEDFEKQKKLDEISDKKKDRGRSRTPKKEEAMDTRKRTTTQKSPQKGKMSEIKKPAMKKEKNFTNKPVMKKYPLRSNKEVEDAEKLLAKYKTTNKKPTKPQSKDESFTELSGSLDELDDTKNDSNYDPDKSTSASSDQLKEKKKFHYQPSEDPKHNL